MDTPATGDKTEGDWPSLVLLAFETEDMVNFKALEVAPTSLADFSLIAADGGLAGT